MVNKTQKIQKIKVNIISTIQYAGRILALIEVEVPGSEFPFRTSMYRSTGSNVKSDGDWFPFSGVAAPNAIKRTGMHTGWIIKDYFYTTKGRMETIPTSISRGDHSNPEKRLRCFGTTPFDIPEVAKLIKKEYQKGNQRHTASFKHPIEQEDAKFINDWLIKGMLIGRDPLDDALILKEQKDKELDQMIAMGAGLV